LGAGVDSAHITVDCDASTAWLVWVDGVKTTLDETSGLVEGALDAIENRLERTKKSTPVAQVAAPRTEPTRVPSLPSPPVPADRGEMASPDEASAKRSTERDLEGGVGLAAATEFWPDTVLMGPRLDVGLAIGKRLAFVIGESARFGLGSGDHGQVMLFDLQAGIAFGAPYHARTALGLVLLVGPERVAVSSSGAGAGGLWSWSASASLGIRASLPLGPVDAWLGVDGIVRSKTIETGGPSGISVPAVSGLLSIGGFLPAFAQTPPPQLSGGNSCAPCAIQ
jgi:hypothetical protein